MGMQGGRGGDNMEECLGLNGKQLFVRVDCNLEEWEHNYVAGAMSHYLIRFMADQVISATDE